MSVDDDSIEVSEHDIEDPALVEAIDTVELVNEPQGDTGGSPNGLLQNRLVRVTHPGGAEQGENNWHKGQLVKRPWGR